MARRNERDDLQAAWHALAGGSGEGWRTIPVATAGDVRILAGRRLPGDEEAVLVGFRAARLPPPGQLPLGRGFSVVRIDLDAGDGRHWIGLSRQHAGSRQLFGMMAADVVETMERAVHEGAHDLPALFIARVRAWQEFMRRGDDGILGPEAEVGLVGELQLLSDLVGAGLSPSAAVEAWRGPVDGLHDFAFGTGAIEAKACVAAAGFPAWVGSLEQLDGTATSPLFLAAVRLAVGTGGAGLPARIEALRTRISSDPQASVLFDSRLLHAGYADSLADRYVRGFLDAGTRILHVDASFPCLTPAAVPAPVRQASYRIDLDLVGAPAVTLPAALERLGVI